MRLKAQCYSFDFETVVNEDETRVWLWGAYNIDSKKFEYGSSIDSFMQRFSGYNCNGYFHNLKFDIQFIFYWLFKNGYKHVTSKTPRKGEFTTLISDMGAFYSATIMFTNGVKLNLYDSLKIIPMSVAEIPAAFGFEIEKLSIDYNMVRELDHVPSKEEIEYVRHDVEIVGMAIDEMHKRGQKKLTTASNAMADFKKRVGKEQFNELFPQIPISVDRDIRKSYKGGWTYLNPEYKDKQLGVGAVYDVNSMYPWAMRDCMLPYGIPIYYECKYEEDEEYPLYVQCFQAAFELKPNKYPSVQIKGSIRFSETEYIIKTDDTGALLCMTSVDYKLFLDNYDIKWIEYLGGYKFKSKVGIFEEYINYWYGEKTNNKHSGNMPMYLLSKLMLNSLYGKFGSNPIKRSKYPYLEKESGIVKYEYGIPEEGKTAYVAVASFITSYARDKIIRTAIACGDRFVYADTDSVHVVGEEIPDIDIDEYRLGAFKRESTFETAKFHRAKCYIESINGKLEKKCAGLPAKARDHFNFETMEPGEVFDGKLVPKNVKGGVVLVDRKFTIK